MNERAMAIFLAGCIVLTGCAATPDAASTHWPRFELKQELTLPLNPPRGGRFDASALLRTPNGQLLTINDRGPTPYRIELEPGAGDGKLTPLTNWFAQSELKAFATEKKQHYDAEGLAMDAQGRLYLCEELNRWILRCDPTSGKVERLPIDWTPVQRFFGSDANASFEGIAIGGKRLYIANERSTPVIIEVDLEQMKVTGHFQVYPRTISWLGTHYSDLCWFEGRLYVLCRQHRVILEVDPATHQVLAEYDYRALEDQLHYRNQFPAGIMEGLSVDGEAFWLVTDNNGLDHEQNATDTRPTLLRCPKNRIVEVRESSP